MLCRQVVGALRWLVQNVSVTGTGRALWLFIVKLRLLWVGIPLLALKDWVGSRRGRRKSGEDEESRVETPRFIAALAPEPEQKRPSEGQEEEEGDRDEGRVSPTDTYLCEYDSTWDTDDEHDHGPKYGASEGEHEEGDGEGHEERRVRAASIIGQAFSWGVSYKFERFHSAARDLQNYRHDYPVKPPQRWSFQVHNEVSDEHPNLDFYLGKRPSSPDNIYISDFHTSWRGNYESLESVHSYIQWLFPLQEPGVNPDASTLTKQEIEEFCQSDAARKNLVESYKVMLDFYGIMLWDKGTGEVRRATNWRQRFDNLNRYTHNNLRITRILKCLGTLGFARYQAPLVRFFLEETLVNRELSRVKESVLNYFLFAVLDKKERRRLLKFAFVNFDESEEFVWCPQKIQRKWTRRRRPSPAAN